MSGSWRAVRLGGGITYLVQLVEQLSERGSSVGVFCPTLTHQVVHLGRTVLRCFHPVASLDGRKHVLDLDATVGHDPERVDLPE